MPIVAYSFAYQDNIFKSITSQMEKLWNSLHDCQQLYETACVNKIKSYDITSLFK